MFQTKFKVGDIVKIRDDLKDDNGRKVDESNNTGIPIEFFNKELKVTKLTYSSSGSSEKAQGIQCTINDMTPLSRRYDGDPVGFAEFELEYVVEIDKRE
jgi:hypothetical protein